MEFDNSSIFFFRSKSQMVFALQEKSEILRKVLTVSYHSPISDSGRNRSFRALLQVALRVWDNSVSISKMSAGVEVLAVQGL